MKTTGFLAVLLVCVSCELDSLVDVEELDSNRNGNNIEIFVTGGLTSQYAYHRLGILKPQSIFTGGKADIPVKGARVYVVSGNDTIFYEPYKYIYRTANKAKAEANREYTLHIEYLGKTYSATDKAPKVKSIEFGETPVPQYHGYYDKWHLLVIRRHYFGYLQPYIWYWISLALSDFDNYLRATFGVATNIHQGILPQGIFGTNVTNDDINGNFGTSVNDSVMAVKFSMSQAYYNYQRAYFVESEWTDNEFRGIPANLPTNFSKGAAGFFYVMDHKTLKCTVKDILDFHGTEYPEEGSNTE